MATADLNISVFKKSSICIKELWPNNFRCNNGIVAVLKMSAYFLETHPKVLRNKKKASLYTEVFINISINNT